MICGFVIGLAIAALIGGLILKLCCSLFNKMRGDSGVAGPPTYPSYDQPYDQPYGQAPAGFGSGTPTGANPYAAPSTMPASQPTAIPGAYAGRGVPEPSYGKAVGIVLLRAVINQVIGFIIGFVGGMAAGPAVAPAPNPQRPDDAFQAMFDSMGMQVPILIASTLISFFVGAAILKLMLPTSYGRACLVHLLEYCVYIVIGIIIFVAIFALFMA